MKTNIFIIAINIIMLTSCSKIENDIISGPIEASIIASIDETLSRATDQTWDNDDKIGIIATSSTASGSMMKDLYKNVAYKVGASGTFTPLDSGIIFHDAKDTVTFVAYYPYSSSDSKTYPGNDGIIAGVDTKIQTNKAEQAALDYLFASNTKASKRSPIVSFTGEFSAFKHKMTRLVLTLKTNKEKGFLESDIFKSDNTFSLNGLIHTGSFNSITGEVKAEGTKVDNWIITNNLKTENKINNTLTYSMILYPQSLNSPIVLNVVIDGTTYTNSFTPKLAAGDSYSYTITVIKTGLEVSGCTISSWNTGGSNTSGEATIK